MWVQREEAGEGREPQESHPRQGHQAGAGPGAAVAGNGGPGRSQPRPGASKRPPANTESGQGCRCADGRQHGPPKTRRTPQRDAGFLLPAGEKPPRPGTVSTQTQTPALPEDPRSSINPEDFSR